MKLLYTIFRTINYPNKFIRNYLDNNYYTIFRTINCPKKYINFCTSTSFQRTKKSRLDENELLSSILVHADRIIEEHPVGHREAYTTGSDAYKLELFKHIRLRVRVREIVEKFELVGRAIESH